MLGRKKKEKGHIGITVNRRKECFSNSLRTTDSSLTHEENKEALSGANTLSAQAYPISVETNESWSWYVSPINTCNFFF